MVLMEDPEILAQILEPPKVDTPQFASSHFVAQQTQTETVRGPCLIVRGGRRG